MFKMVSYLHKIKYRRTTIACDFVEPHGWEQEFSRNRHVRLAVLSRFALGSRASWPSKRCAV